MRIIAVILFLSITSSAQTTSLYLHSTSKIDHQERSKESDGVSVDIVPDKGPDIIPDEGPGGDDDPTGEPTGPPDIMHRGWSNVSALEDVSCNLKVTPLQIKTDGQLTGEREINLEVAFVGGVKKALVIQLKAAPQIKITDCTETPVPISNVSHLVGAERIVWTISKSGSSLTVISNNVESLIYNFSDSPSNCSADWEKNTTHVTFTTSDTASHEHRLKPKNCTSYPGNWPTHVRFDKNFPVTPGTLIGVTCVHGDWNVGDSTIVCNTNLYSDFEYKKTPWCLAMRASGSEVMEGSRTTLTCNLSNIPREEKYKIQWTVNGNKTTDDVETGDVVDGEQHSTVIVKKTSPELDYWCYVEGHEDWRKRVYLNAFTMQDNSKDTKVGDTASLGCFVQNITTKPNIPTIVWKMADKVLSNGPQYKITTKVQDHGAESCLEVKKPSEDMNFTCLVRSGLYPSSPSGMRRVTLNTYTMSTECVIRSKEKSVVACQVTDISERMNISWFRDDEEKLSDTLESFKQGVQRSVLFLSSGNVDESTYTCRVDSIKRPQSVPSNSFVNLATINPEKEKDSLVGSPVIWCLVAASVMLCAAVATLSGYLLKVRKKMEQLTFRISTREKLDSITERPDTILRNRAAPTKRDVESLRRTLDRRPPNVHMSDVTDNSSENDAVFD